jgi:hypothetical protein
MNSLRQTQNPDSGIRARSLKDLAVMEGLHYAIPTALLFWGNTDKLPSKAPFIRNAYLTLILQPYLTLIGLKRLMEYPMDYPIDE